MGDGTGKTYPGVGVQSTGTYDGHDETTAPRSMDGVDFTSPGTYTPVPTDPAYSVNSKRPDGVKGQ